MMPEGDPEESGEEEIEFSESSEVQRFDFGFGRAYLKYIMYITIPVLIIYYVLKILVF